MHKMNAENRRLKLLFDNPKFKEMNLSAIGIEVLGLKKIEEATGADMGAALPQSEQTWSATEVGKMLNVSAMRIGITAKANNLKTEEYGTWVLDKSRHSSKEVSSFRYNAKGVDALRKLLGS